MRFHSPVPTDSVLARAKKVFGNDTTVTYQQLEKCKRWKSAIAYLTHSNDKSKYQYDDDCVVSNYDWKSDRDCALANVKDMRLLAIRDAIEREEMREFNLSDFCTIEEYSKYKKQINDFFEYVYSKNLKDANRQIQVMYLSGDSGTGKTTFAKHWCDKQGYSYAVSSSSNDPMQDYRGQDVLILDDFRPGSWKMPDLLKLLDNHTMSSVKSRYHNKQMCYCKMIIITSVVPLSDVWSNLADKDDSFKEPIQQLYRRVGMRGFVSKDSVTLEIGDDIYVCDNPTVKIDSAYSKLQAIELACAYGFKKREGVSRFIEVSDCEQLDIPFD